MMTVVFRNLITQKYLAFIKGADSVILSRVQTKTSKDIKVI